MLSLSVTSQVNIDFESPEAYKSVGVYDAWEQSPFRSGELTGNYAITANPDATTVHEITGEIANPSATVLGAQRSRFGSNTFGVRVDLKEEWPTNTELQYVHVLLNKPTEGRVMLIGLGSREERLGQNKYCEQFWELSTFSVRPGEWCDAVFAIKTANGVNIRSLVLVPDCESPHKLTDDFLFYIDDIVINDNPLPRLPNEFYPISGDKATMPMTRTDRSSSRMTFKVGTENQYVALEQSANKLLYQDMLTTTFFAQAGQTVTPSINFNADWMHAYCYIDYNQDGQFSFAINEDGTPAEGSEIVAYNHYNGKNSKGANVNQQLGSANTGKMPSFKLPDDIAPGMYRVRMKIDWNSLDPMGNSEAGNKINDNGGVIADAMLCIYGDKVVLNDFQLNGEVLAADGTKLSALEVPANEAFTIKSAPEKGFHNGGVVVNCGHNPNGERLDKYGNPRYNSYTIKASEFNEDGTYTIAAKKMRGNILFNGIMTEDGAIEPDETIYTVSFPKDLKVERTDRKLNSFTINNGTESVTVSMDENTENFVYVDMTTTVEIPVQAGQTISPSLNYNGNAMHNYWFVDFNEDGEFSNNLNANGTPTGELLSYSCYNNKNSAGTAISVPGQVGVNSAVPFKIPENTPAGLYRCRMKIDWNNIDPKGQYGLGQNDIDDNGGYVVDFLFHVYDDMAAVTANVDAKTGNLVNADVEIGSAHQATRHHAIEIAEKTSTGVTITGIKARYGYHLDNNLAYHLNHTYWTEESLTLTNGTYVISAEKVDRPIKLTVEFDGLDSIGEITVMPEDGEAYDLRGIRIGKPSNGIYIINGQKVRVN